MKKRNLISLFIVIIMTLCFSFGYSENNPISDKTTSTNFQGKVIDKQSGESLAGVLIEVTGTEIKVYTDLDGNYSIKGLDPGKYTITINYISYKKDVKIIEVKENQIKNFNIILELVK